MPDADQLFLRPAKPPPAGISEGEYGRYGLHQGPTRPNASCDRPRRTRHHLLDGDNDYTARVVVPGTLMEP